MELATSIMKAIGAVLYNFGNDSDLPAALRALELIHCPRDLYGTGIAREHFKVKKKHLTFLLKDKIVCI